MEECQRHINSRVDTKINTDPIAKAALGAPEEVGGGGRG